MLKVLKIPGVLLASSSIIVTSMSIGFLQATLEPHLRQFSLPPIVLGLMFVINGGTYALTAPAFGWLCDTCCSPKAVTIFGTILTACGFGLVGPAPFLPIPTWVLINWSLILGFRLDGTRFNTPNNKNFDWLAFIFNRHKKVTYNLVLW